jgi:hypothetical protein
MANDRILIGSDMTLTVDKTKDANTGEFLNTGSWAWSILDRSGNVVGSGTLTYAPGTDGKYVGTIDKAVTGQCQYGKQYFVVMVFSEASYDLEKRLRCKAVYDEDDLRE